MKRLIHLFNIVRAIIMVIVVVIMGYVLAKAGQNKSTRCNLML